MGTLPIDQRRCGVGHRFPSDTPASPKLQRDRGDFSARAIALGRSLASETGLDARFIQADVLHEFPFTMFRAMPYPRESDDGARTWRLPEPYDGKLPLLFSLKAAKPTS
jgi:hypothetical protein